MKSYQEYVVKELRQIAEDNQQLNWFKNKLTKQNKHAKGLEESLGILSEKLRKTAEDNRIVRQRTKMQHEQNREEVCFFNLVKHTLDVFKCLLTHTLLILENKKNLVG